jgi:hypothetical protein
MKTLGLGLIFFCTGLITANAWIEASYDDWTVVDRSELIVVGHLKDNSIQYVPHTNTPDEDQMVEELRRLSGQSNTPPSPLGWEHHAILVISGSSTFFVGSIAWNPQLACYKVEHGDQIFA